jgi:hypothetical protein
MTDGDGDDRRVEGTVGPEAPDTLPAHLVAEVDQLAASSAEYGARVEADFKELADEYDIRLAE